MRDKSEGGTVGLRAGQLGGWVEGDEGVVDALLGGGGCFDFLAGFDGIVYFFISFLFFFWFNV